MNWITYIRGRAPELAPLSYILYNYVFNHSLRRSRLYHFAWLLLLATAGTY